MAIFISEMQMGGNWVLVLPPWPQLHHWRSQVPQERLPWSHFFDLASLQKFAPVVEMIDYLDMHPPVVDQVFILQHFENMFETGNFIEKFELQPCNEPHYYQKKKDGKHSGKFWGIDKFKAKRVDCLSFHGHMALLSPLLHNSSLSTVVFDHAEVPLHERYGDTLFWRARRSMSFARPLRVFAEEFRKKFLNSTDADDGTIIPEDWTLQKSLRKAFGGPYLGIHLRRRDFLLARSHEIPSILHAAAQIEKAVKELNLNTIFLASDCPEHESEELRNILIKAGITMVKFTPTAEQLRNLKDGGVAIVDQIICSYARKFIGTHESTFSLRIQEEREILGFKPEMTFNRFCGNGQASCQQPAKWLIRY